MVLSAELANKGSNTSSRFFNNHSVGGASPGPNGLLKVTTFAPSPKCKSPGRCAFTASELNDTACSSPVASRQLPKSNAKAPVAPSNTETRALYGSVSSFRLQDPASGLDRR